MGRCSYCCTVRYIDILPLNRDRAERLTQYDYNTLSRWQASTTEELLPGDLFSLRRTKKHDPVPCDCMLVHGSAVLNEATLTGESVPQMKEGVLASKDGGDEARFFLVL